MKKPVLFQKLISIENIYDDNVFKILYQPLPTQNIIKNYILARKCKDRAEKILIFCQKYFKKSLKEKTLLDIGTNYGYFLFFFKKHCFKVFGIENEEKNIEIAKMFYPKISKDIEKIDVSMLSDNKKYDIVLFLGVFHYYIINNLNFKECIKKIDQLTKNIMFFEMGQEHETVFFGSLNGWNPDTIKEWILKNTTFDFCEPIMIDNDDVGELAKFLRKKIYGRTIFACYRKK